VKDQTSFGKYICHIRDRFKNTTHTIWVQKLQCKGNHAFSILFKKYMDVLVPTLVKINKYKPRTKQVVHFLIIHDNILNPFKLQARMKIMMVPKNILLEL
jgi:hypothetical protein